MDTRISATELAKGLSDVLNRIRYRGERFVIERNGQAIATLAPLEEKRTLTLGEFVELLDSLPKPDDGFADDLEAIQAEQKKAELRDWPS